MAPWCIHISCLERVARSGSGRDSVRGLVGAMDAELSQPDWLATVQSGRKQVQSRVCTPGFTRKCPAVRFALLQSLSRSHLNAKLNECTWPNKYSSLKRKHVKKKYLIIPNNVGGPTLIYEKFA